MPAGHGAAARRVRRARFTLTRSGPLAARLAEAGIPLVPIGKRWKLDPQAFWRLKEHVARLKPDLVHTWMFAANTYGFAAAKLCGVRNIVAGQRCVDPWKSRLQLAIDGALARHCRRVVVNSEGVRDFYVEHGTPAEQVRVIANGVAPPDPPPSRGVNCWPNWNCPPIAGWWPRGPPLAAEAGERRHLGGRPAESDPRRRAPAGDRRRPATRSPAPLPRPVSIRDKVHFLGERGDVPRILSHCDVLWSTSGYEGQSNVILEAMAAGVPIVATDIPGTRELVVSSVTGYLVPVGDRASFAKWTERLLSDAALAGRLAAAARQRIQSEFSVEKMVARHVELYREVLG